MSRVLSLLTTLAGLTLLLLAPTAQAGIANAGLPGAPQSNPLAGLQWGNYTGSLDEVFPSYWSSSGEQRQLLGLIALRPRMRWFGDWYSDDQAQATAEDYIQTVTNGDPNVMAQMAVFRLDPWEGAACHQLPSAEQQASYRRWIDAFAAGIGSARVAMVLQPDLPFEVCVPGHSTLPMTMVAHAAQVFSSLPHTTVYIDAGASDWATVSAATTMLREAGIRYVRGFALGATHYASTSDEIEFGAKLSASLARAGYPGRHFVINTAQNGAPFTYQQYHDPSTFDNARVCPYRGARHCVTLGIPPTWHVADRRWGLSARDRRLAQRLADGYLWIGRPWLYNQNDPFEMQRSLQLASTTPYG